MNDIALPESLPEKASLEQLRKQAKELQKAQDFTLTEAQHALARRYGFRSWPKLKFELDQRRLRKLIRQADLPSVEALLKQTPRLAATPFPDGDWPMHMVAELDHPELVALLHRHGARLNTRYGTSAHSPLSWAVTTGAFRSADKLVELGSEPDLFCAAGLGHLERVQSFWVDGKLKSKPSQTGSSRTAPNWDPLPRPPLDDQEQVSDALYIACRANRLEVARWLLDHGADPNFRGYIGATCLAWAEFADSPDLAALLRERGASDELFDYSYQATPRQFPVMVLAGWGFAEWLDQRLSRNPETVHTSTPTGTPLHAAARAGQMECAQVLLRFGADKDSKSPDGQTPLDVAEARGHARLAELLR